MAGRSIDIYCFPSMRDVLRIHALTTMEKKIVQLCILIEHHYQIIIYTPNSRSPITIPGVSREASMDE